MMLGGMTIAVLALQGAFAEHQQMLASIGVESVLIRNLDDWTAYLAQHPATERGLIIPGGESTSMTKIMADESLTEPLREAIAGGLPTFGTCAGMIMLDDVHLGVMDITVLRNAYGRQLGSFYAEHEVRGLGVVPMTFIRAPYVERAGRGVEVLSVLNGHIVAARQQHMLVCSFHPELNADVRIHRYFVEQICGQ